MSGEFEWDDYALQAQSGVAESMHAAGCDDALPEYADADADLDDRCALDGKCACQR